MYQNIQASLKGHFWAFNHLEEMILRWKGQQAWDKLQLLPGSDWADSSYTKHWHRFTKYLRSQITTYRFLHHIALLFGTNLFVISVHNCPDFRTYRCDCKKKKKVKRCLIKMGIEGNIPHALIYAVKRARTQQYRHTAFWEATSWNLDMQWHYKDLFTPSAKTDNRLCAQAALHPSTQCNSMAYFLYSTSHSLLQLPEQ